MQGWTGKILDIDLTSGSINTQPLDKEMARLYLGGRGLGGPEGFDLVRKLAAALGGVVGDNPQGKEFGTVAIRLNQQGQRDRLFEDMPGTFTAQACHSQSVLQLPTEATLLASSEMDPHHAFAIGKRAWGVQFHPEFNGLVLRHYIQRFADDLEAQGCDVDRLLAGIRETPQSETLLRRFQRLCTRDSR